MQNRKPSPWGEGGWPKARRMRGQVSASSFVEAAHCTAWERPDEGIGPYEKNELFQYPLQGRVPSPARRPFEPRPGALKVNWPEGPREGDLGQWLLSGQPERSSPSADGETPPPI